MADDDAMLAAATGIPIERVKAIRAGRIDGRSDERAALASVEISHGIETGNASVAQHGSPAEWTRRQYGADGIPP